MRDTFARARTRPSARDDRVSCIQQFRSIQIYGPVRLAINSTIYSGVVVASAPYEVLEYCVNIMMAVSNS